jgi:hypothetical protein
MNEKMSQEDVLTKDADASEKFVCPNNRISTQTRQDKRTKVYLRKI